MSVVLLLNHLSLPFANQSQAEGALPEFLMLLHRVRRYFIQLIRLEAQLDPQWYRVQLAQGYFFQDWFEAQEKSDAHRDLIRSFKNFQVNQPLIPEDLREEVLSKIDAGLQGDEKGEDLYRACVNSSDAFLLSFNSHSKWEPAYLKAWKHSPEDETLVTLNNLSTLKTLKIHEPVLESIRDQRAQNGKDLWRQRQVLFPALKLIHKMSDLKSWPHGSRLLAQAREVLSQLNTFAEDWQAGKYENYQHQHLRDLGLDVSGESESVRNNPATRRLREFTLSDGNEAYCENHVKNFAQKFRMHFYPDAKTRKIYVVYFGPHLKT